MYISHLSPVTGLQDNLLLLCYSLSSSGNGLCYGSNGSSHADDLFGCTYHAIYKNFWIFFQFALSPMKSSHAHKEHQGYKDNLRVWTMQELRLPLQPWFVPPCVHGLGYSLNYMSTLFFFPLVPASFSAQYVLCFGHESGFCSVLFNAVKPLLPFL